MGKLAKPVTAIFRRLTRECASKRILEGFRFQPIPVEEVQGDVDLPAVHVRMPTLKETQQPRDKGEAELLLTLIVSVRKAVGLDGLIEALEKVLDAVETDEDGTVDESIDGSIRAPFSVNAETGYASDLSLNIEVGLLMQPKTIVRGKRRS